jgi:hypothetical protein
MFQQAVWSYVAGNCLGGFLTIATCWEYPTTIGFYDSGFGVSGTAAIRFIGPLAHTLELRVKGGENGIF